MKKLIVLSILLMTGVVYGDDSAAQLTDRTNESAEILHNSASRPDQAIPRSLINKATCIATFPNVVRVGFIFGAKYGQGLISCRVEDGWSSPSFLTLAGGSWGFQIGVNSTDLILVFVDSDAVHKITDSKLKLGVGASVAAGPMGREAAIGTDFNSAVYAYSRTNGLYAGLTLEGSVLAVDDDANKTMYGNSADAVTLLKVNYNSAPPSVWSYVRALMDYTAF